jgi:hypothetical protein
MSFPAVLKVAALNLVAVALGAAVAVSCTVDYGTVAFRCSPRQADNCPDGYFCCSDDPNPLFSGTNNANSSRGMCVEEGAINNFGSPLPGCPTPCDPTWDASTVTSVCGGGQLCCQTVELGAKDCVLPGGTTYRPVTGEDVFGSPQLSNWSDAAHNTHQDPGAEVCIGLFGASGGQFEDCVRSLTAANRRGFCMAVPGCPTANPAYLDACECLTQGLPPDCSPV